jgi:cytochrome c-type biogenesis protein CcmH/NrfG
MNPKDANIHNNLAWLYVTAKDEKVKDNIKALEHAVKASALSDEKNAEILDTLAMVYFVNGKVKEAVDAEQKALKLEPGNERFKGNLKKYEEGGK